MAAPSTAILDDFNRASLGTDYSTYNPAGSPLAIHGSTQLGCGSGASYTGSYRNVATYSRPCETYITVTGITATNLYFGLHLLTAPNGSSSNGYKIGSNTAADPDTFVLYRIDSESETTLGTWTSTIPNGSKWALQLDATHARLWSDEGAGWVERASAADTTYSGPFYITIDVFDPGQDDIRMDDLGGGSLAAAAGKPKTLAILGVG